MWWRRRTATCGRSWSRSCSARTSTSASRCCRSRSRRCADAGATSRCWPTPSCSGSLATSGGRSCGSPTRPSASCASSPGRATCGSCRTAWSAPRSCAMGRRSDPRSSASTPLCAPARVWATCSTSPVRSPSVVERATARAEEEAIAAALRETGGDRAAAAARLGISLSTLSRRLRHSRERRTTPDTRARRAGRRVSGPTRAASSTSSAGGPRGSACAGGSWKGSPPRARPAR